MVLAVSAGVVIYAYTMGYLGGFGGTESLGAMSVDTYSGDSSNITAYVRNIGGSSINITTAYINGELANITGGSVSIPENEVMLVDVSLSAGFTVGHTYEVKLIAEDNTQLSFSCKID
jgi:hypothetical protein